MGCQWLWHLFSSMISIFWYKEAKKLENVPKISQPIQSLKECYSHYQSIPLAPFSPPTKPHSPFPEPRTFWVHQLRPFPYLLLLFILWILFSISLFIPYASSLFLPAFIELSCFLIPPNPWPFLTWSWRLLTFVPTCTSSLNFGHSQIYIILLKTF